MKILLDHSHPFLLAHGGVQTQIEQTKSALERARVDVEFLRWWDPAQYGDIIHYFGPIPSAYLALARQKRIPVVLTRLFSETCNRSDFRLAIQGLITRAVLSAPFGESIKGQLQWRSYKQASHLVVGLQAEKRVLETVYGVEGSRVSVVPLGIDDVFINAPKSNRSGPYLISVGTINAVKRSIELAEMARSAEVPVLFVGNSYSTDAPYWKAFHRLVDDRYVRYKSNVEDRRELIRLLAGARGFVLFSKFENWSLAAHEAAACGLPLLLPDRKWSRECFGGEASYFASEEAKVGSKSLKNFYDSCAMKVPPSRPCYSWDYVATQLLRVYTSVAGSKSETR